MSDDKREKMKSVPRDLPMPTYQYQRPQAGTFTVKYNERKKEQKKSELDKAVASLQHARFAS